MKISIIISFLAFVGFNDHIDNTKELTNDLDKTSNEILKEMVAPANCNSNFDTTLVRLVKSFHATSLDVTHSMSKKLNQFMLHIDTNCLRKQKMYPFFISAILAKVVLYQLTCCNQHYEMRHEKDGAEVILGEFEKMAGFENKQIEFLSSYEVEGYIQKTPELYANPYLNSIMTKIKKERSRIAAGHI